MSKCAYIGAFASLLLVCAPAQAEWRSRIVGAPPILPTAHFQPRIARPLPADVPGVSFDDAMPVLRPALVPADAPPSLGGVRSAIAHAAIVHAAIPSAPPVVPVALEETPDAEAPIQWVAPLVDRRLPSTERGRDIAPELIDAVLRIEPMYDPTRLYGGVSRTRTGVSAGTAAMDNVFADRWQRADLDANVNQRVAYIAMAWHQRTALPCDAFSKNRARGYNQPALTALSRVDCALLLRTQARGAAVVLAPIVAGLIDVPVFAAPMPGARLSSAAFWAARREEIARAEAELKLRTIWHGGKEGIGKSFARR